MKLRVARPQAYASLTEAAPTEAAPSPPAVEDARTLHAPGREAAFEEALRGVRAEDLEGADGPPRGAPEEGGPGPVGGRPIAVFVTHGMGQQLRFETLDLVANGLERALRGEECGRGEPTVFAATVKGETTRLERLAMHFEAVGDRPPLDIHLYEGYWAPLTEGNVTLRDVMRFLWSGAANGLRQGIGNPLQRFMFNRIVTHDVTVSTFWSLAFATAVLTSLVVLNTVIGLIALGEATGVLTPDPSSPVAPGVPSVVGSAGTAVAEEGLSREGFPSPATVAALTGLAAVYLLLTLLFGIPLAVMAAIRRRGNRLARGREAINAVLWGLFWVWAVATIAVGVLTLVLLGADAAVGALLEPAARWWVFVVPLTLTVAAWVVYAGRKAWAHRLRAEAAEARRAGNAVPEGVLDRVEVRVTRAERVFLSLLVLTVLAVLAGAIGWEGKTHALEGVAGWGGGVFGLPGVWAVVWGALFVVSGVIRSLLVQYLGDVAAYVSSFKLDRFNELRKGIKEAVCTDLGAVYGLEQGGQPLYEDVLLVGHSLGSVVTYDAINRLLNEDAVRKGRVLKVAERTKLLLTFGSPLDKTAYVFRQQNKTLSMARETLAATVQPLISDYARFRTFPWVNVYAPRDIIGGALDLYDLPEMDRDGSERLVDNRVDPQARIPLVAHTEHWDTSLVFEVLAERIEALAAVPA